MFKPNLKLVFDIFLVIFCSKFLFFLHNFGKVFPGLDHVDGGGLVPGVAGHCYWGGRRRHFAYRDHRSTSRQELGAAAPGPETHKAY